MLQSIYGNIQEWRFERKFFVSNKEGKDLVCMLKQHPAAFKEIYHPRKVSSIYFDTPQMRYYQDNVDGVAERIKVRLRWYGALFGEVKASALEWKVRRGNLIGKSTLSGPSFYLDKNISEKKIQGLLEASDIPLQTKLFLKGMKPVLINSYQRRYFLSADRHNRVTLDTGIEVYRLFAHFNHFLFRRKDNRNCILELKYAATEDRGADQITEHFPYRLTKNSKYAKGIEALFI